MYVCVRARAWPFKHRERISNKVLPKNLIALSFLYISTNVFLLLSFPFCSFKSLCGTLLLLNTFIGTIFISTNLHTHVQIEMEKKKSLIYTINTHT